MSDGRTEAPLRQRSAKGLPKPHTSIERTCRACGAGFIGLAFGKTGERGIWTNCGQWYCSVECAPPAAVGAPQGQAKREEGQRTRNDRADPAALTAP